MIALSPEEFPTFPQYTPPPCESSMARWCLLYIASRKFAIIPRMKHNKPSHVGRDRHLGRFLPSQRRQNQSRTQGHAGQRRGQRHRCRRKDPASRLKLSFTIFRPANMPFTFIRIPSAMPRISNPQVRISIPKARSTDWKIPKAITPATCRTSPSTRTAKANVKLRGQGCNSRQRLPLALQQRRHRDRHPRQSRRHEDRSLGQLRRPHSLRRNHEVDSTFLTSS